jgi:adenosine/AMP kinase
MQPVKGGLAMELLTVPIDKPEEINFIFGQSHFIKTVEDLHEALVGTVPGIEFGLAFCEASGPALIRTSGTSPSMVALALDNARMIAAGHTFIIFLANAFPINVLNAVKAVPEVCRIFCATANPVEVILAETDQGRAVLGVVDGVSPKGVEGPADIAGRTELLRRFGYKLG